MRNDSASGKEFYTYDVMDRLTAHTDVLGRQAESGGVEHAILAGRAGQQPITNAPLNRGHARSIEQAIIHNNPHFDNEINSISPTRDLYNDAVSWGENWLTQNGINIKWPTD
ncbi:hypothetical protein DTU03_24775 [Salmonella enterica subsp. enterica serovar Kintambo]|uniref:Uncharacterized protein n=1 Tax=Salmonella enterica subsp. enterica serovar Kintambo TaxID=1192730 RepID=A0A5W7S2B6_SALET|nr:hypothetical protein [Salmonella enterica subsp. enterica serovar Kintambo]